MLQILEALKQGKVVRYVCPDGVWDISASKVAVKRPSTKFVYVEEKENIPEALLNAAFNRCGGVDA